MADSPELDASRTSGFWSSETMKRRFCEEGLIKPFEKDLIANCAYELRMGPEAHLTGEKNKRQNLDQREQLSIQPGHFAQLLTEEVVRIPADALGLISMKSRLKLRGLVNVSGFHVDPGFEGQLLFSVYNAGPQAVVVSRGEPTFLLWLAALDSPTEDLYEGDRGSGGITDEDVMRLQGNVYTPHVLANRVEKLEARIGWRQQILHYVAAAVIGGLITLGIQALDLDSDSSSQSESEPSQLVEPNNP